jgi:streptogramin lyase
LAAGLTEFPVSSTNGFLAAAVAGLDGSIWFADGSEVGRRAPDGTFSYYQATANQLVNGLTVAPDGTIWFTQAGFGGSVGRIAPDGTVTEFALPLQEPSNPIGVGSMPESIVVGPDGNLWFPELGGSTIDRMTPTGTLTQFAIPTANSLPVGLAVGSDGALWFTEPNAHQIGRITTAGAITEYALPNREGNPDDIVAGPDGALWFTMPVSAGDGAFSTASIHGGKIGRITPGGTITEFALPSSMNYPTNITVGPDGALWFSEDGANSIGRITTAGMTTEIALPASPTSDQGKVDSSFEPGGITAGPDGSLWFGWYSNVWIGTSQLVRLDPHSVPSAAGSAVAGSPGTPFSGVVATLAVPGGGVSASDITATIDWGDGHTSAGTITDLGNGTFTVSGTNTYASAGTDTIKVVIALASPTPVLLTAQSSASVVATDPPAQDPTPIVVVTGQKSGPPPVAPQPLTVTAGPKQRKSLSPDQRSVHWPWVSFPVPHASSSSASSAAQRATPASWLHRRTAARQALRSSLIEALQARRRALRSH